MFSNFLKYYFLLIVFLPKISTSQDIIVVKSGNVGINNDNPQEKLDLNGILKISDSLIIQNDLKVKSSSSSQYLQKGYELLPKGAIIIWTKTSIPLGWALCDGTKGTPNLSGRFVLGVGRRERNGHDTDNFYENNISYGFKVKGGTEEEVLKKIPAHSHEYRINNEPENINNITASKDQENITFLKRPDYYQITTGDVEGGSGQPHTNLPPYYVLYYIMKL